jgi:chromosome segregation ATPase
MESLQRTMASRLTSIESKLEEHSAILSPLRERVESLHGLVEKLVVHVDHFEQEYTMITAALRRLETNFDQLEAARLRERITSLETRVSALESVRS